MNFTRQSVANFIDKKQERGYHGYMRNPQSLTEGSSMNKKRLYYTILAAVIIICIGVFYVQTQRQKNFAKTREVFAPVYTYSGKLTPEQQKEYSEFADSLLNVSPDVAQKYRLPQREQLQLEAHIMTLYRDNPELILMRHGFLPADTDVKSYQRHFGILALITKTKIADLPANSRKLMMQHLVTLNKKLIQDSINTFTAKYKDKETYPNHNELVETFGIQFTEISDEGKPGVFHMTDIYGKEHTVDLTSPAKSDMTVNTTELYAEIDRLFEILTDEEFQRLSTLSKTERTAAIEMLFSSL